MFLHQPEFCSHCGNDLKYVEAEFLKRRQIIDIPIINPEYTEQQIFKKVCRCGFCNVYEFPTQVNANISYGENERVF
ncbi:MAG: IS66 family transposase zinc-finger binding domain-containing protein [Chryseobacterium sp.]|nr:IS66 family transposase zinc-finger binding domain-containing protein [Chryseobacterium sp.]